MAKQDITLSTDKVKEKELELDKKLGKNRLKVVKDIKCNICNKKGTIIKTVIDTALNIPVILTSDDLPLGTYWFYKCSTKNCTYEMKILIEAVA